METKVAVLPPVRAALSGLIDYAGLFPPAKLELNEAFAEYRQGRKGLHAWMLGRFIIPWPLLSDLSPAPDEPFSTIVEARRDALAAISAMRERGARIEAVEIPPSDDLDLVNIRAVGVPAFVEIARSNDWSGRLASTMSALAAGGLGAKLRCGGMTRDAFPSVDEVAKFIAAAAGAQVPFKATAGLHHPVRHVDAATGFPMHGFLNLLAASALASRISEHELRQVVAEEEPDAFRFDADAFYWRGKIMTVAALEACRESAFVAYGSCSFAEPVDDLKALGILPA